MAFAVEEELLHDSWDDFPVQPGSISELMATPRSAESEPEPLAPAVAEVPPVQLAPVPPPRPTETRKTRTSLIARVFSLMRRPR